MKPKWSLRLLSKAIEGRKKDRDLFESGAALQKPLNLNLRGVRKDLELVGSVRRFGSSTIHEPEILFEVIGDLYMLPLCQVLHHPSGVMKFTFHLGNALLVALPGLL